MNDLNAIEEKYPFEFTTVESEKICRKLKSLYNIVFIIYKQSIKNTRINLRR